MGVAVCSRGFVDIADIEHRLLSQEAELAVRLAFLGGEIGLPRRLSFAQQIQCLHHQVIRLKGFLLAGFGALLDRDNPPFKTFEIGEHQLGFYRLGIGDGIDARFHMGDVAALEAAQDMHDGVRFPDRGEKLVAQPFALGSAAHKTGNVNEVDAGGYDLGRFGNRRELVQTLIGHRDIADIGLHGAEHVIGRFRRHGLCHGVE
jgi:hypothetical protein